ncbi:MAG: hypothetical protein ACRDOU_29180 [Streptosporangiaceae bacterium]
MSHDKIRAAARKRMAETGEPYATARREVIKDHQAAGAVSSSDARWFALDYSDMGRVSRWDDTRRGGGPGRAGVVLDSTMLRVLVPGFRLDVPRASIRSASHSARSVRGTYGVHGSRGRWLVNGSYSGLVELAIDPPCYAHRQPTTLFLKSKVSSLTISLVDPDAFIAAVESDGPRGDLGSAFRTVEGARSTRQAANSI